MALFTFAQKDATACLQYECKAVIDGSDVNHRVTFKNAPEGEFGKATPSWYVFVERNDGQRVFIRMDENNFVESTDGTDFENHIIGRPTTISFLGWDGKYHEVSFSDAKEGFRITPDLCPKKPSTNSECTGNACAVVTVSSPGGKGISIKNNSKCNVNVTIRFAFGLGDCMAGQNVLLKPNEQVNYANSGYCSPYTANYE